MRGSWLDSVDEATTAALTALRPDLAALIARFDAESTAAIGERLRSLLAVRVAQMVGDPLTVEAADPAIVEQARQWPTHPAVSAAERAALDLAESFVMDAHSVTDEQVVTVQRHFGDEGAIDLLLNLALLDGFTKFRRVFSEGSD